MPAGGSVRTARAAWTARANSSIGHLWGTRQPFDEPASSRMVLRY